MSRKDMQPSPYQLTGFTYDALDASAAAIAREAAEVIGGVRRQAIQVIGKHLQYTKKALPHGAFTAWVRDVVRMRATTAGNYMRAAALLEGKPATVAELPATILYALASPATPAAIVQDVMADAEAGAVLDAHAIRAKLDAAVMEQRELKVAQRRNPKLTSVELQARRARQAKQHAADQARAKAKDEQELAERRQRLRPLVERVMALGGRTPADLLDTLNNWRDAQAFGELLREACQ